MKDKIKNIIIEAIGWIGAFLLLLGYFLIQTKRVGHDNQWYIILNIVGSFGLMINAGYHRAYPSTITNLLWLVIGSFSAFKIFYHDE